MNQDFRCDSHTWQLVRQVAYLEGHDIVAIHTDDGEKAQEITHSDLNEDHEGDIYITHEGDDAWSNLADLQDEWLACKYCLAEIRGDRLAEILCELPWTYSWTHLRRALQRAI